MLAETGQRLIVLSDVIARGVSSSVTARRRKEGHPETCYRPAYPPTRSTLPPPTNAQRESCHSRAGSVHPAQGMGRLGGIRVARQRGRDRAGARRRLRRQGMITLPGGEAGSSEVTPPSHGLTGRSATGSVVTALESQ